MNKRENDDSDKLWSLYSGYKRIRTILCPYLLVNLCTSYTVARLTVFTLAFCPRTFGNLLKVPDLVAYRDQFEVAPLKNLFSQAVLK